MPDLRTLATQLTLPADSAQTKQLNHYFLSDFLVTVQSIPILHFPLQVRFFLHTPLQLASVLFAATSTPDICGRFFETTDSLRCIGIISMLQLSLGLVLPSVLVYFLESRTGHGFMPHMQVKRWLLQPFQNVEELPKIRRH